MLAILKKVDAESLGPPPKFQVNIEIQLNTARVSRLSFHSYDYKLTSKGMPNICYLTFSKFQFSKFKKFVSRSVFGELQVTQISLNFKTSCYNLKIRGLGRAAFKTVCDFSIIFVLKGITTF